MALENLDELIARRSRMAGATWGPDSMEDGTTRVWQPETAMYNDIITGKEVWRISSTPDRSNLYHNDSAWTQWSSNGKWLAFASDRDTNAFTREPARIWMFVNTNGSTLVPATGSSIRGFSSQSQYIHWNPQLADTYYQQGSDRDGLNLNGYDIYKNEIASDGQITRTLIIDTSLGGGNTDRKMLRKTISGDGEKILLREHFLATGTYNLYPCTVTNGSESIDDVNGYPIDRDQGNVPPNTQYGNMVQTFTEEHSGSLYLRGNSTIGYIIFMTPEDADVRWTYHGMSGSDADGGHAYTDPGNSGEIICEATRNPPDNPWVANNIYYWGHLSPNPGGTHVVYNNSEDPDVQGVAHEQLSDHTLITRSITDDFGQQHNDWHAFSDYSVTSYNPFLVPDALGMRIFSSRYDDVTETDITTICFTHAGANGGAAFRSFTRPFMSPDGTKVGWHSEFLNNGANQTDIFWAVLRNPRPPTTVRATASGANINLTWTTPSYTNIGWPDPVVDNPPVSKEIQGYHVWVSDDGSTGWTELTTLAISSGYDTAQANSTTKYYAVTSEEYCTLESNILSEVRKIVRDGGGAVTDTQETVEGTTNWWTTPPPNPTNSEFSIDTGGPYTFSWTEPSDSKIRFYHIYYATTPASLIEDQQHRIASVPIGTNNFNDWLADTASPGEYKLVSVDRYGNEGIAAEEPLSTEKVLGFIS